MNYTPDSLRKKLAQRLNENDMHEIAYYTQGIEDTTDKQLLYNLLFDEDRQVSNNAAWVFTHFDLHSNTWLYSKHDELINEAMHTHDNTQRRLLLTLLLRQPFTPSNLRSEFLDFCLKRMYLTSEPTAIKVLCMKLAYEQCKFYSELLSEFREALEIMEPDLLPAALKTARKNILKTIKTDKPRS